MNQINGLQAKTDLLYMYNYLSRSYHTAGSLWILDPVTKDGLNDCGRELSFTSVNLITANVTRLNSSVGSTYSLKFCPGLTLNYTYIYVIK